MCGPACVLALLALAAWAGDARPIEILRPDAASLPTAPLPGHSQAFVTLLYNDDFVNGLRVLGQSLRETRTERFVTTQNESRQRCACNRAWPDSWHSACTS